MDARDSPNPTSTREPPGCFQTFAVTGIALQQQTTLNLLTDPDTSAMRGSPAGPEPGQSPRHAP